MTKILLLIALGATTACTSRPLESGSNAPAEPARSLASEALYQAQPITSKGLFPKGVDGPAMDMKGNLYVANLSKKGTIGRMRRGGQFEHWLTLPESEKSVSSSLRFDSENRLLIADFVNHRIFRVNPRDPKLEVYFSASEAGVHLNQPNDIAIAQDGTLYLSDPGWNKKNERRGSIWKISPEGRPEKIVSNLFNPNGIELSPDESKLYFTESSTSQWMGPPKGREAVYVVDLVAKTDPQLFADYPGLNLDGMRTDSEGNLFVTVITGGAVDMLNSSGQLVRRIKLTGKEPTNIGFGGPDGRTAYVTQRDGGYVESFRVEHPGRDWVLLHDSR